MRYLLTGARGYIGGWLTESLLDDGHDVHCLGRRRLDPGRFAGRPGRLVEHQYEGTSGSVERCLARAGELDAVVHLAACATQSSDPAAADELLRANVVFPMWLVDAASARGVRRVVNTASWWQWDPEGGRSPRCLYSATKQCFQDLLGDYAERHALAAITLVMYDVYGPRDPRGKILSEVVEAARTMRSLPMTGGEQLLSFVHVRDVVRAYRKALAALGDMEPDAKHRTYHVWTPPCSLRDAIRVLEGVMGQPATTRFGALPYPPHTRMRPYLGPPLPGWNARVDLEQGFRELVHG